MTKKDYVGAYLDGCFSDKKVPYGFKYFSMLEEAEKQAEKRWKLYKKTKTMTPKEKADEICRKMLLEMEWHGNVSLLKKQAKQCALIAVDEVLSETEEIDGMRVINNPYWIEVRNEIEKL